VRRELIELINECASKQIQEYDIAVDQKVGSKAAAVGGRARAADTKLRAVLAGKI